MNKRGKIIIRGRVNISLYSERDKFEMRTIYDLRSYAKTDIKVLEADRKQGVKSPDIEMNGLKWEIKNPKGKGKYVISRNLYTASKQSSNIVLDLRRMPGSYKHYLSQIKREFNNNPRAKRLLLITKARTIIEFAK